MVDIGRDDGAATGDFGTDEFGGYFFRDGGAEAFAGVLVVGIASFQLALRGSASWKLALT
jgi:hypothetical protein